MPLLMVNNAARRAGIYLAALLGVGTARAQIPMGNGTYAENFDSLSNIVGTSFPWTNKVTLPGWYASKSVAPTDVTNHSIGTGSSTTGSFYAFGSSRSAERALGSLASSIAGNFAYGGRTPFNEKGQGTDHNPCGSGKWMAGGGGNRGTLYGATDEIGLPAHRRGDAAAAR
ncbi:MAG TPA: DUF1501 domain-containing protein [Terriglobales bacterium]|nr:DUF1501 domain-containing protein [Terriglobales bacterium]